MPPDDAKAPAALERAFHEVYQRFKLEFYRRIFGRLGEREASLTVVESFCLEVIYALGNPSVGELARFLEISQPNAAYKVASLVKKGYVSKQPSPADRREVRLVVTERFWRYHALRRDHLALVVKRMHTRFSPEELAWFEQALGIISRELMPELPAGADERGGG